MRLSFKKRRSTGAIRALVSLQNLVLLKTGPFWLTGIERSSLSSSLDKDSVLEYVISKDVK